MTLFFLVVAFLSLRMLPEIFGGLVALAGLIVWCVVALAVVTMAFRIVFG